MTTVKLYGIESRFGEVTLECKEAIEKPAMYVIVDRDYMSSYGCRNRIPKNDPCLAFTIEDAWSKAIERAKAEVTRQEAEWQRSKNCLERIIAAHNAVV